MDDKPYDNSFARKNTSSFITSLQVLLLYFSLKHEMYIKDWDLNHPTMDNTLFEQGVV